MLSPVGVVAIVEIVAVTGYDVAGACVVVAVAAAVVVVVVVAASHFDLSPDNQGIWPPLIM